MPFKKGDFLLLDYTAKVKETGETFDTTNQETAKSERLYKEGEIYEPKLIVVGEGWLLKTVDDALPTLKLNKSQTIEIPPDKAFGPRDPEKLKTIPLKRLRDKGITPQLGQRIEYDKKLATIRTLGAGRVTLDFNPPLAGKTLVYEVVAKKKLKTPEEKIAALIHRRIPVIDITKFQLDITKTQTTIHVPEDAFYLEGLQLAKRGVAADIQRFFSDITKIRLIETFETPKKEVAAEEKPAPKKKPRKPKTEKAAKTAKTE